MPSQVRQRIGQWQQDPAAARWLVVDDLPQYTGERVYALTITDPTVPREAKRAIWFCVPHAHEPAGTAASIDVAHQLLTGYDLWGQPCEHDVSAIRQKLVVTLNPDANPGGRRWAPVLWWDGSRYTNEEFWPWMFGVHPDGQSRWWKRVARWDLREESPLRPGIAYEQVSEHVFVEPNRDPESSLVRLFRKLDRQYRYDQSLHLHQTEFERSDRNCMINLPVLLPELSPPLQEANLLWARQIIAAWEALDAVARAVPAPRSFPYYGDDQTTGWFRACWGESEQRIPQLTVEVQNNNPATPPGQQLLLMETAIWNTITVACSGG